MSTTWLQQATIWWSLGLAAAKPVEADPEVKKVLDITQFKNVINNAKTNGIDPNEVTKWLIEKGYEIEWYKDFQKKKATMQNQKRKVDEFKEKFYAERQQEYLQRQFDRRIEQTEFWQAYPRTAWFFADLSEADKLIDLPARWLWQFITTGVEWVEQIWEWISDLMKRWDEVPEKAIINDAVDAVLRQEFTPEELKLLWDPNSLANIRAKELYDWAVFDTPEYQSISWGVRWEEERIASETVWENVLDIAQGWLTTAANIFAPWIMFWVTTAWQTELWGQALESIWWALEAWWQVVNELPWLRNFKSSLPEDRQKEFDQFIWETALAMFLGWRMRNQRGEFDIKTVADNFKPKEVIRNFNENVVGVPGKRTTTPTKRENKLLTAREQVVRDILQQRWDMRNVDIQRAIPVLEEIDLKSVKGPEDLRWQSKLVWDSAIQTKLNILDQSNQLYMPSDFSKTSKTTQGKITVDYVRNALDDLNDLYWKTNELDSYWPNKSELAQARIQDLITKYETEWLTLREIEDIASEYSVKESWFSDKTGAPRTSTLAEWREATRSNIKNTVKQKAVDEWLADVEVLNQMDQLYWGYRAIDRNMRNLENKSQDLQQKYANRWWLYRLWGAAWQAIKFTSLWLVKWLLESILDSNVGNKTLNNVQLANQIWSLTTKLDNLNKKLWTAKNEWQANRILNDFFRENKLNVDDLLEWMGELTLWASITEWNQEENLQPTIQ